jgi:hypothetical protein
MASAPVTLTQYMNVQGSAYQQRIYNTASAAGASAAGASGLGAILTPDPDALRSNRQQWLDYYQSYIQTISGGPIGGPSDLGG